MRQWVVGDLNQPEDVRMIIDSHAYCFAPADSLLGYDSVAEHLQWVQAGQAGHYQAGAAQLERLRSI